MEDDQGYLGFEEPGPQSNVASRSLTWGSVVCVGLRVQDLLCLKASGAQWDPGSKSQAGAAEIPFFDAAARPSMLFLWDIFSQQNELVAQSGPQRRVMSEAVPRSPCQWLLILLQSSANWTGLLQPKALQHQRAPYGGVCLQFSTPGREGKRRRALEPTLAMSAARRSRHASCMPFSMPLGEV